MSGGYKRRTRDERRRDLAWLMLLPAKALLILGAVAFLLLALGYR